MLRLSWACDWQGCGAVLNVPVSDEDWEPFGQGQGGWIAASWSLGDDGWQIDGERRVWCPVHSLLADADAAVALELRPPKDAPQEVLLTARELARRYPGDKALRVASSGGLRVTFCERVSPSEGLIAALLEHGQVVLVRE